MLAYNIVNNEQGFNITLMLDFKPYAVTSSNHRNIEGVVAALRAGDLNALRNLLTKENFVNYVKEAGLEFKDGNVLFNGETLDNVVARKIEKFYRENVPYDYLLKFLENLMQNPSEHSRKQLYTFMEKNDLPIDSNGHFIAYKRLRHDYTSIHSGKGTVKYPDGSTQSEEKWHIPNNLGNVVSVDRSYVTDDPNLHCSYGLHLGSLSYVRSFGANNDPIVICTVNPRDVVSVPNDCNATKIRACEYVVHAEFVEELKDQAYKKTEKSFVSEKGGQGGADSRKVLLDYLENRVKGIKYDRSQVFNNVPTMLMKVSTATGLSLKLVKELVADSDAMRENKNWNVRKSTILLLIEELR